MNGLQKAVQHVVQQISVFRDKIDKILPWFSQNYELTSLLSMPSETFGVRTIRPSGIN
jgi:hypothetical protein